MRKTIGIDKILQKVIELLTDISIGLDNETSSVVDRLMQIQKDIEQLKLYNVSQQHKVLRNQEEWLIKNTALSGKTIDEFKKHFKQ